MQRMNSQNCHKNDDHFIGSLLYDIEIQYEANNACEISVSEIHDDLVRGLTVPNENIILVKCFCYQAR